MKDLYAGLRKTEFGPARVQTKAWNSILQTKVVWTDLIFFLIPGFKVNSKWNVISPHFYKYCIIQTDETEKPSLIVTYTPHCNLIRGCRPRGFILKKRCDVTAIIDQTWRHQLCIRDADTAQVVERPTRKIFYCAVGERRRGVCLMHKPRIRHL